MTIHFNKYSERDKRKILRSNTTQAENILWRYLRKRQIAGFKFRRQYGVDAYVIDFFCIKVKLAIEIDGEIHLSDVSRENDQQRQEYLESFGITFLRFKNQEIFENIDNVLRKISETLKGLDS